MATSYIFPEYSSLFTSGLLGGDASPRGTYSFSTRPSSSFQSDSPACSRNSTEYPLSQSLPGESHFAALRRTQIPSSSECSFLTLDPANEPKSGSKLAMSNPSLRRIRSLGSREKFTLPSAKPAPSTSLPDVPGKPRPSRLVLTFSTHNSASRAETLSAGRDRIPVSPSLQSSAVLSPGEGCSPFHFSPTSTPPLTTTSEFSTYSSESLRSSATPVSPAPDSRQRNRSAALAALEGRSPSRRASNFIHFTDDEEDTCRHADEHAIHKGSQYAADDCDSRRQSSLMRLRSRVDSYFASLSALTSFIDLRDDGEVVSSKSYRSFVDFGS